MQPCWEVISGLLVFDQLPAFNDIAGKIAIGVVDVFDGIAHGGVI